MNDECDHEWEPAPLGMERCLHCGEVRPYEPNLDPYPDRDYSKPYEP